MGQDFSYAVVLDFEATCWERKPVRPQEIIEFPSVLVLLDTMEVVDEFTSFVRPFHNPKLTSFCCELTSITQKDVDGAPLFHEVLAAHGMWMEEHGLTETNSVFVTCGDWDLGTMLPAQCKVGPRPVDSLLPVYTRWLNIKVPYNRLLGRKAPGMAGMLKGLGIPLTGVHHRGIDDCRNITKILGALVERGALVEPSSRLPLEKYPPIHLCLKCDGASWTVKLPSRNVKRLRRIAGRRIKRNIKTIALLDGTRIVDDEQLFLLRPGEELLAE